MSIIVIPTYNEKATIQRLIHEILELDQSLHVLVVDDSSPDGTALIVESLQPTYPDRLHLLVRPEKAGLASAYLEGFRFALDRGHSKILQMDADFSHQPEHLPQFLSALDKADLVIGSRYLSESKIQHWPWYRQMLSRVGIGFSKYLTHLKLTDPTSGFKAWRSDLLSQVIHQDIHSHGFAFQIETNVIAQRLHSKTLELPIKFVDRSEGSSKMSLSIIVESAFVAHRMRNAKHKTV